MTATSSSTSKSRSASKPELADAFKLLIADHDEVKALFKQYEKLAEKEAEAEKRSALAEEICEKLKVHTQIEEEILYPAAREVLDETDMVDEADVEHASAKDLIAQIESSSPDDDHYDAKVKVLGEYVDHHVQEEQNELFKELKKAGLDSVQIGEELAARKQELMAGLDSKEAAF